MSITQQEAVSAARSVEELATRWEIHAHNAPYLPLRTPDAGTGLPVVHLEDVSGVPFVSGVPGIAEYQHRARVRAGSGDLFVAVTPQAPGFDRYCQELGLGSPEFVLSEPAGDVVWAVAKAAMQGAASDRLVARAKEAGGLVLHPYMAMEDVWDLAFELSERSGTDVLVTGPPPAINWVANDKALFSDVVIATAGEEWLLETKRATTALGIAALVSEFSGRYPMVGVKRTRCASAMGNYVFRSAQLGDVDTVVAEFLKRTEWPEGEEVLVVEWAETDLSPSTQLWIPQQGMPVCEGVYEQLLEGETKSFLGSRPSTLPGPVNEALKRASLLVAAGLQAMGYAGRCSFDFVITGDVNGEFEARFTECNGRWGGTSTPMRMVDRVIPGPRPAYVAQDWMAPELEGMHFEELRHRLRHELYSPETGRGRFLLYNVGPLVGRGKFDVLGIGDDAEDAWHGVREVLPRTLAGVR
ncbi:MAG: hypothetical protein ACJAYU_000820 [Bradymonadia bacterium]|jgi:hypothetical protein